MDQTLLTIREATDDDAAACASIYRPFVTGTAVSFEIDPPSDTEMATRIRDAVRQHAWLVAEVAGEIAGYAYARPFAAREAYRWSCETSIYLAPGRRGTGLGGALYEALLARLADRGYRVAVAKMTLPNPASERLHEALGFRPVGVHQRIGFKHGAWHDIAISQRELTTDTDTPPTEPA
ncbi:GNAT family N-acetyltransferase [Paractinoplanes rishiriensis]|uniref:N-acetyltransferase n=1 Tax=Paractinoplanes rishiriensis TaxID=1050105 RepID=A0A919K1P4_9ACTN|nr:GNAT family N-acetyltransferase [Actinoplanes rishiriensis]GIE99030.1 N-acetyltransferase [Actinoplanes rishiriensis]